MLKCYQAVMTTTYPTIAQYLAYILGNKKYICESIHNIGSYMRGKRRGFFFGELLPLYKLHIGGNKQFTGQDEFQRLYAGSSSRTAPAATSCNEPIWMWGVRKPQQT